MPESETKPEEFNAREIRKFARILAALAVLFAVFPALLGWLGAREGEIYLPHQTGLDDHMVYAAWMKQAQEGNILFDNRFTTDEQPGLTFQAYFLVLGWISKVLGLGLTAVLARVVFGFLAIVLLGELLIRLKYESFSGKFALVMATFGGGISYLLWEMTGQALTKPTPLLSSLLQGQAPIDNWQPEAFVFPSLLVNSLFMAALCLILYTFIAVLDARNSWKPVLKGVLAFGLLMNIHSYDVLLITFVLIAFLVALIGSKQLESKWVARALVIGLGALPAAAWFLYVLKVDPVFQARAATLTYTGSFRPILIGILPAFILALVALWKSDLEAIKKRASMGILLGLVTVLFIFAAQTDEGYQLGTPAFLLAFASVLSFMFFVSKKDVGWNLVWAWASVALVAPYFPALFQRKLSMMLIVPWAILGAAGLVSFLKPMERGQRNLVAFLALTVCCGVSLLWFTRETYLVKQRASNTKVHGLYLSKDAVGLVDTLNSIEGRKTVLAMPGVPTPTESPSDVTEPYLTDLNPILSGLAGAYTFAGHWSETPSYNTMPSPAEGFAPVMGRRDLVMTFFVGSAPLAEKRRMLSEWKIGYIAAPNPQTYDQIPLVDLSQLGELIYQSDQFLLYKVD